MLVKGEIVIKRPIEEVFDFVADERNEPKYNPEMTVAEKVTDGPVGVGTTFHSVVAGRGGPAEMTIEFTQFDRPRRILENDPRLERDGHRRGVAVRAGGRRHKDDVAMGSASARPLQAARSNDPANR